MKTVCIYHSIDLDGWMSAAIVKHWFINNNNHYYILGENGSIDKTAPGISDNLLHFMGYNYGQPIPDLSEYDNVIMVDISFPKDEMYKLKDKLIWIDHHISAIKDWELLRDEFNCTPPRPLGILDKMYAACELTWKYFFPNKPMPEIVRLLGRYDCFGHKGTDEEQKVLEFQYGARASLFDLESCYDVLKDWNANLEHTIQIAGYQIYNYLCVEAKQSYKNGFDVFFRYSPDIKEHSNLGFKEHTSYKFICINKERFNPINFGIDYHSEGYDGAMCFHYGNNKWNFSLYNDNGKVDCSVICKEFGGGGHKGAAGFTADNIDFLFKYTAR